MLAATSFDSVLPILFIVTVVAGFVVGTVRIRQKAVRMEPLRESAGAEPVMFQTRVQVKVLLSAGWWSMKTLGPMELTIGITTLQLTSVPELAGRLIGSERFFSARETQIRRAKVRTDPLHREWITLSAIIGGRSEGLAVRPVGSSIEETWEALLRAGCQPF